MSRTPRSEPNRYCTEEIAPISPREEIPNVENLPAMRSIQIALPDENGPKAKSTSWKAPRTKNPRAVPKRRWGTAPLNRDRLLGVGVPRPEDLQNIAEGELHQPAGMGSSPEDKVVNDLVAGQEGPELPRTGFGAFCLLGGDIMNRRTSDQDGPACLPHFLIWIVWLVLGLRLVYDTLIWKDERIMANSRMRI
jgi:hypothetical protein